MGYLVTMLILLALLYVWMLRCRRNHPHWEKLQGVRFAHRGYHDKPQIPENSMAAFRRARERGWGVELDVHLTRDGALAVIHDASLLRTAGADVYIEDLTVEELKQYRLEGTQEQIPLLEEVLELFAGGPPMVVELKAERGNHDRLAEAACRMLDRYPGIYAVESFDPRCIRWLYRNRPEILRGQLSAEYLKNPEGIRLPRSLMFALQNLLSNCLTCPDFIAYRVEDRRKLSLWLCRKLYGVREFNWTVTEKEKLLEMERLGNHVIFERFDPEE